MAANEWVKVEGGTEGEAAAALVASSLQDTIPMDCPYEEVFKEITKKLYGEEEVTEEVIYDAGDAFRTEGLTVVAAGPNNGLPPGAIVVQRRIHQDDKGRLWAAVEGTEGVVVEERWFESEETLNWTTSKIARYNPSQKVFRCVDCDFVGFLSRVAEHWLGNHASLRVFQCPRCPYTSAWARCVRMHLSRQHGETLTDNSMWKENPVVEEYKTEVTKYLNGLKAKVEARSEGSASGERRYTCPYCPYATDRRDLYNRHENIHRDEKPFQCYVCDKQFNRADHVKKHFVRMHRDHPYDITKIKKHFPRAAGGVVPYHSSKMAKAQAALQNSTETTVETPEAISLQLPGTNQTVTVQQIPHIAYFNPPSTPGQSGPLQGIAGVGGTKKEAKAKGPKKKKSGEKMYTCSYCPWQGVDNWCLKRHLNTHIKPFLCALCDYKAARSERLATHVLKVHNKRVCHKCSFLADDTESLSQHIQDSHQNPLVKTGFNCNVCQEYFELRADLEAHAILEHQKVIVQCDLCDFRTTDELSMEAHLRDKHNLQPGMGAVAAAAAAAAAAANGQSAPPPYIPQQQQTMEALVDQSLGSEDLMQSNGTLAVPSNANSMSETTSYHHQESSDSFHQKVESNASNASPVDDTSSQVLEGEMEQETLCEKCGIEFADEASLKLHEKVHELSAPTNDTAASGKIKKCLPRTYVCSTCSYTAATKKIMMQHQRAHNGLELVCQAESCLFSTPFENTLKEHIHNEHGNEPNVRCPHCGLRIPSVNAFTYHWRAHHSSVCSLCVNLYRIKYAIKENDLHEIISKSCLDLLNQDLLIKPDPTGVDPTVEIKTENQESSEPTIHSMECEKLDSLNCLTVTHNNNNNEAPTDVEDGPPRKKHKMDFSLIFEVLKRKENRESLKIIPSMKEVFVTPVVSEMQLENMLKCNFGKTYRKSSSSQKIKPVTRNGVVRLHPSRRYIFRGSRSWLHKNKSSGFKCHSFMCHERVPFRYPRKVGVILHKLWHHHKPNYKCDYCDLKFCHLYQALLHKKNCHSSPPPSNHLFLENHHEERSQFFQDPNNRSIEFHL